MYVRGAAPKPPNASGFVWLHPLGWGVRTTSSPAIVGNVIYLGANYNMLALEVSTQKILWSSKTKDLLTSSPAVTDSTVYFGSHDGSLYAVDRASGDKLWNYTTGAKITSSPAVADGMLYVGSHDGTLYAFE